MNTEQILKTVGVSAAVLTGIVIIGGSFYVYKTFMETRLINYQIQKIKKELGTT